jgi:hypothetical protein
MMKAVGQFVDALCFTQQQQEWVMLIKQVKQNMMLAQQNCQALFSLTNQRYIYEHHFYFYRQTDKQIHL